jgi:predicted nucleic acid-binding protein
MIYYLDASALVKVYCYEEAPANIKDVVQLHIKDRPASGEPIPVG